MQIKNFRGNLTDILVDTEALLRMCPDQFEDNIADANMQHMKDRHSVFVDDWGEDSNPRGPYRACKEEEAL